METSKLNLINSVARGYLLHYAFRYNQATADSRPSYSGFCEWVKNHSKNEKECDVFERRVLARFLIWLKSKVRDPNKRLNALSRLDLEQFLSETNLQDLLDPGLSYR